MGLRTKLVNPSRRWMYGMDSKAETDKILDDTLPSPGRNPLRLRFWDLLWLLAYPVYQILGTLRHEGSHAIAAILQGAKITEFVFWPTLRKQGLYWGYVNYHEETNWPVLAAPYFMDLITFVFFFAICMRVRFRRKWIWLNLIIIGMISPLVNSLYNYWGRENSYNDVYKLFADLPRGIIHGYFIITLIFYFLGIWVTFRRSKSVLRQDTGTY
jgi:hypothetical protein